MPNMSLPRSIPSKLLDDKDSEVSLEISGQLPLRGASRRGAAPALAVRSLRQIEWHSSDMPWRRRVLRNTALFDLLRLLSSKSYSD